jgi:hypothetical protein
MWPELSEPAPYEAGGVRRLDLSLATRVLLLVPVGTEALDVTSSYMVRRRELLNRVDAGEFVLQTQTAVPDLHVALQVYNRRPEPRSRAACQ